MLNINDFFLFIWLEKRKFKMNSYTPVIAQKYCECTCVATAAGVSILAVQVSRFCSSLFTVLRKTSCVHVLKCYELGTCVHVSISIQLFLLVSRCIFLQMQQQQLQALKQISQIYFFILQNKDQAIQRDKQQGVPKAISQDQQIT